MMTSNSRFRVLIVYVIAWFLLGLLVAILARWR